MFRLKDGVVVEEVLGEEGIIVNTNTGQYLRTNKTALMMIEAVTRSDSVETAVEALASITNVDRSVIERDMRSLLARLVQMQIVEETPPTPRDATT